MSESTLQERLRREQIHLEVNCHFDIFLEAENLFQDAKIRSAPSQDEKSENLLQKVHQELEVSRWFDLFEIEIVFFSGGEVKGWFSGEYPVSWV